MERYGQHYALNAVITLVLAVITIMCNHALSTYCDVAVAVALVVAVAIALAIIANALA